MKEYDLNYKGDGHGKAYFDLEQGVHPTGYEYVVDDKVYPVFCYKGHRSATDVKHYITVAGSNLYIELNPNTNSFTFEREEEMSLELFSIKDMEDLLQGAMDNLIEFDTIDSVYVEPCGNVIVYGTKNRQAYERNLSNEEVLEYTEAPEIREIFKEGRYYTITEIDRMAKKYDLTMNEIDFRNCVGCSFIVLEPDDLIHHISFVLTSATGYSEYVYRCCYA